MASPDTAPDHKRRRLLFGASLPLPEPATAPAAAINEACLAFRAIACMSCRDACPTGAIRFALALGGARPRVEAEACTGCGECAPVCPAAAIAVAASMRAERGDA